MSEIMRHSVSGVVQEATSLDAIVDLFVAEKRAAVRALVDQPDVDGVVVYANLNRYSIYFGHRTAVVYGAGRKVASLRRACEGTLGKDEMTFQFPTLFWRKRRRNG